MARIFIDTNLYIDITKRAKEKWKDLEGNILFISPLSTHILFYTRKLKVPDYDINALHEELGIIPLTKGILKKALAGPTRDLEDNIQLHSAVEADCDIFLTSDEKLLKMAYFGKVAILPHLKQSLSSKST